MIETNQFVLLKEEVIFNMPTHQITHVFPASDQTTKYLLIWAEIIPTLSWFVLQEMGFNAIKVICKVDTNIYFWLYNCNFVLVFVDNVDFLFGSAGDITIQIIKIYY